MSPTSETAQGGRRLVIVESPAKAKTIKGYLGPGYVVEASVGHIRDLPNGAAEVPDEYTGEVRRLGVDVEHDFQPIDVVNADKKAQVRKLSSCWPSPTNSSSPPMRTARAKPSRGTSRKSCGPRSRFTGWSSTRSPRTRSGLLQDHVPDTVTLADALKLMSLPRVVGEDAEGVEITAQNGRYGPYLKKGTDSRSLTSEDQLFDITLEEALAIYAQPKQRGRAAAKPPLKELGTDPVSERPVVVKDGRFGPYVTDGETNATLRTGDSVEEITPERGYELLAEKRAKGPAKKKTAKKAPAKKATAKKTAAKKTTATKTTAAKKTAAKKTTTAKKATATKTAAKKATATKTASSSVPSDD
ncbi:DNA topoisomerase 1 [Streptomyces badius]